MSFHFEYFARNKEVALHKLAQLWAQVGDPELNPVFEIIRRAIQNIRTWII